VKKSFYILTFIVSLAAFNIHAMHGEAAAGGTKPTSIGIVIYSNDAETVWNAFRLANYSVDEGDTVRIFLLGKGVELESLDGSNFNVKEQMETFLKSGGKILACGTCLQSRSNVSPKACTVSTMGELYEMIRKSSIILTF
jgi:sulfur relay (sulfurtransferase) complex TusBCD TusD component (DsrE family)